MLKSFILYDIPSKLLDTQPPKAKNLPFQTVRVEYPDVPTLKVPGASLGRSTEGTELCTVPVLSDPNTGALVADSWAIAEYLDKTYPEKPIFPDGSKCLISALNSANSALRGTSFRFSYLCTSELGILNERSREYFTATREATIGEKVDDWSPEGPKRDARWSTIEENYYDSLKTWYEQVTGKWVMEDIFSYADMILATHILWLKRIH